ncbi:phage portal protein [Neisseria shayeganii]|uniref:Phage portal protein n=1 Tax=Neisseria shayeganii TaxID=607712 RepID=A0A7D7NCI5_9NEIS|nr:phage portal protein [Neisseria shayeganii]QMT41375.1 phage portal protein [Neisseria shayeganii]
MKIFGFEIKRALRPIAGTGRYGVREPFTGAWQQGLELKDTDGLLRVAAVYACVSRIAADISKLGIKLVKQQGTVFTEANNHPAAALLKRPNHFQNGKQFFEQWLISRLLYGNTYILKKADAAGAVQSLHVLDPRTVKLLVADDGSIFYQTAADQLAGVADGAVYPARQVIHDRGDCLFHPLIGVSPLFACAASGTLAGNAQAQSGAFFANASRPGGLIVAPENIAEAEAKRLADYFNSHFTGANSGKVAAFGGGLKFEPLGMSAVDAELIEQLKWSVADIARAFKVPLHKIDESVPITAGNSVEAINLNYYQDCLQSYMEAIETCLDDGLNLSDGHHTEFDVQNLLRMDSAARVAANVELVKAGIKSPNEARADENLPPVAGGESPMIQQQNYSLAALAQRDAPKETLNEPAPTEATT